MEIRNLNADEIKKFSIFASSIFKEHYLNIIGEMQADYMINLFLSKEAIEELINTKNAQFRIIEENNEYLGFTEYLKEDNRLFLSKLYVAKDHRHKHLGKALFLDACRYAKDNKLESIYLTVNKYNTDSFEIYKHLGFKIIDSVKTDIGNNYIMDDYVMELKIDEE